MGRSLVVDAVGPSGEDYSLVAGFFDLLRRDLIIRFYFGKDILFSHSASDELIILPSEIQD